MGKINFKLWVTAVLLVFSVWALYPSVKWSQMSAEKKETAEKEKDTILNRVIRLGLDLKGGTHLLLEVDSSKLDENVKVSDAIDRAIEIIRNRIDEFGVAEPMIARQGDKWIVVQLPGIKDPKAAKELLGKTALLEFRIVDNSKEAGQALALLSDKGITPKEYRANPSKYNDITKLLPAGSSIYESKDASGYYVLDKAVLTGASLVNAKVELNGQFGMPHVSIEFNKDGAKTFADVTGKYRERNLAIVLDDVVQSAPRINSRIPDGKAIIEGNFTADDAKLLATVLRAGALPAPVKVIEERTVGPSLGNDSIQKGFMAAIVGVLAVLLFMIVYYRTSGVIASIALVINLVALMAFMAYFQFTLTLPGVAGIALTLAMAVDANVLILERIREELSSGKTSRVAVDAGYQKVFWTIFDANLTTLIAAVFLFQFGTGPIKGFAVTLSIGLIISMFTAIVVTKLIYEFLFKENLIVKFKI
ncbi:protein translocase subunit SecD [Endomicrobium proavitum]|uniref:Protein translocase subunit SecD n=1 Tax=Endomicrobium proavitum TaxID=1408281 RepID=A0A0G3WJ67_9BACT|nr:protein translocase subunit SecD [Endomicrobium proavitum]AKL97927.1 Protein translocase subunit SecD [Endomicrobium proavitum]